MTVYTYQILKSSRDSSDIVIELSTEWTATKGDIVVTHPHWMPLAQQEVLQLHMELLINLQWNLGMLMKLKVNIKLQEQMEWLMILLRLKKELKNN